MLSWMVMKATSGVPTAQPTGAPGRVSVALKYSSGSTMLSRRVLTESVALVLPAGMDILKDPPM